MFHLLHKWNRWVSEVERWGWVRAIVVESLLHNHHDAYSLNVTRERCMRGRRMTLGLSLEDRAKALSSPSVEGNKPTRCSLNGPASHCQRCLSAYPCECCSSHCCSFCAARQPLQTLGERSCATASKPLLRIAIVSVQQHSSAGWTSSSFLEETKDKSGGEYQKRPSWPTVHLIYIFEPNEF